MDTTRLNLARAAILGSVLLGGVSCLNLEIQDGFPCSQTGDCPAPYQCRQVGGKLGCYEHNTDGGLASGGASGAGGRSSVALDGSAGTGGRGTSGASSDASSDVAQDAPADAPCGSASDAKNCGACGHDCTILPNVSPGAVGVECRASVCYVPASACATGYGHCSSRSDDGCETSLLDSKSCGGCGVTCAAPTSLCATSATGPKCASACVAPTASTCGSSCVNLTSDPKNCGTCGHDCTTLPNVSPGATGVTCSSGACVVPAAACSAGFGHCSTRPDDGCETDLKTQANCGSCGKTCVAPTALCSMSGTSFTCSSSCVAPSPNLCATKCVDLTSDPTNCGACNHDCTALPNVKPGAAGIECRAGVCYVPPAACAAGYAHCSAQPNDGCEAALTTPAHCGSCTLACSGATPLCSTQTQPASCLPSCSGSSPNVCGTQCVNLMTDAKNCGACGHACTALPNVKSGATAPAVQCVAGACVIQAAGCANGFGHCSAKPDDGCETDLTRPQTCGSCTNACTAPTALCSTTSGSPMCSSSCVSPNPDLCGSKCVDKKTDPTNCGTCGHDCTALPHLKSGASVQCNGSGGCVVPQSACAAGYANCSSGTNDTDGCETPTNTTSNCGGCGIACTQPNATATCASGSCGIASCNAGFGDCTSAPGCETPLNTVNHCGACTTTCGGGTPTCSGSPATCTCASPKVEVCGNAMCCSPPPANAVISCAQGSACSVQCATNYHACNGSVSPCYSDTDVQHCSGGCLDCRQPNANAVCGAPSSTQCANTCLGSTLSCPGFATKPSCGSWAFESNTTEGWYLTTDIGKPGANGQFGVSTAQHLSGSYSLFIGNTTSQADADAGGTFSTFRVDLCSSGAALDLSGKTLSMNVYTVPTVGGDLNPSVNCELFAWTYGSNDMPTGEGGYLDPQNATGLLPARQWTTLQTTLNPGTGAIEIEFRPYNNAWSGTVYFDDINIQ